MGVLSKLPRLEVMKMKRWVCKGQKWGLKEDERFCQLVFLKFDGVHLEHWEVNDDNFPKLERLILYDCSRLEEIPSSFEDIQTLKSIKLRRCLLSAVTSAKKIEESQHDYGNTDMVVTEEITIYGEVRIRSSFDATKLFFSHPSKEFVQFSNSFRGDYTPLRCIESASRLGLGSSLSVVSSTNVLITSIEDIYSKKQGILRYKLVVHVADHTGDALMLIWDRECANLVGGNVIPHELECLRGLSMLFQIVMKKDKVESYYSAFTVLRICRDEAVLTQHCWADVGDGLDFEANSEV
nr:putative late blight resistance protein homolog R1B-16 isoform X1 [Ipomoea batatas]